MEMSLKGRGALVTDVSRNIGRAVSVWILESKGLSEGGGA